MKQALIYLLAAVSLVLYQCVTNENISSLIVDSDSSSFTQFTVEVSNATGLESQAIQITTDIEFDSSLIIEEPIKTFVFNFADRSGQCPGKT